MPVKKTRTKFKYHRNFVQLFEDTVEITARRYLRVQAERLTGEMKDLILGQRQNWYPLSPKYLAEKVRQGYDPRILIRTKQYVESMQVVEDDMLLRFQVTVPDAEHNSGLPFRELGRILEFGRRDGKKPYARPHWRPVWGIFIRDLPTVSDQLGSEILSDFRQRLSRTQTQ